MDWIKAFHVIFMVSWFAGLFYLPRLYVYHADATDTVSHERFLVMEKKLFIIMTIGAVGTLLFGLWYLYGYFWPRRTELWLHIKIFLVAMLLLYHVYCFRINQLFRKKKNTHSHKFYRLMNEVPALLLMAIVILVEVQPWRG